MNLDDCIVLYIEDDPDMTLALKDYFEPKFNIKFINSYDMVPKILKKLMPCLVIVDDNLHGKSRYVEIANDIKHIIVPTGKSVAFIGCSSLDVDIKQTKTDYKKIGYYDFLPNTGKEKELVEMEKLIKKIITSF